jgi:dTDP-4-amino-4,6-dideoxygalactose transaminase
VSAGMHYPIPVHLQKQMECYDYSQGDFPNSEYNASRCVSLPMFETITDEQLQYVVDVLNSFEV